MRILLLVSILTLTLGLPTLATEPSSTTFALPAWMDIDFGQPVPAFDDLLEGESLPVEACGPLVAATASVPFESTPDEVLALASDFDELGVAVPGLEDATSAVATSLRNAAERGADRQAMLSPWFDRAASNALRQLSYLAMGYCDGGWQQVAMGPADRLLELAEAEHPGSARLDDVASWGMSLTGSPTTVYWSFGYLGDDAVGLCDELSATLAGAGFGGTELAVHDADLDDAAEGLVGGACRRR